MAKLNTAIRGAQIASAVAADGLKWDGSENLSVDVSDFAGTGVEDDGSENLRLATQGNGIAGGAGSTLSVDLDGSTLALGAGGLKLAALTDAYILVGNVSNVATGVAVSGDVTISNSGVTAIGADKVTNTMLANMTQGTVKVGGAANAPTDLDAKTDKYILIGDGTDITSVAVSGDITISNLGVVAIGATKVIDTMINDDVATGLAGNGLSATTGVLAVDLNELATEATFAAAADYIAIVDATDNGSNKTLWSVIATAIAGTGITALNGVLSADTVTDNIIESDIQKEMEAGDNSTTIFNLTSVPISNSVQVFLRGVLQEEGSGKDYVLGAAAKTVTFATAPLTGDAISIFYIINN